MGHARRGETGLGIFERSPEIPWKGIIGFRNVLAHEYGAIDYRRLYTVIEDGIPALIVALEKMLDSIQNT